MPQKVKRKSKYRYGKENTDTAKAWEENENRKAKYRYGKGGGGKEKGIPNGERIKAQTRKDKLKVSQWNTVGPKHILDIEYRKRKRTTR